MERVNLEINWAVQVLATGINGFLLLSLLLYCLPLWCNSALTTLHKFSMQLRSGDDGGHSKIVGKFWRVGWSIIVYEYAFLFECPCLRAILEKDLFSHKLDVALRVHFNTHQVLWMVHLWFIVDYSRPEHNTTSSLLPFKPRWDLHTILNPATWPAIWSIHCCAGLVVPSAAMADLLRKVSLKIFLGPRNSFSFVPLRFWWHNLLFANLFDLV